jgi:hypothetical protein
MDDKVFIVGGGPSIDTNELKKLNSLDTIAVNKSAFFVPNPTHFITMDYSFMRKVGLPRVKNIRASKHFVLNMSIDYIQNRNGVPTDIRSGYAYNQLFDIFDTIHICHREDGVGLSFGDFRCGNNSGYCAMQLAFILGYKEIYLLGFDMGVQGNKTHFHSGYRENPAIFARRAANYISAFATGIKESQYKFPETKLFSCSKISGLNNIIPYKSLNEVVK